MIDPLCIYAATLAQAPPAWWPWPQRHRDVIHHWTDRFNFLDLIPGPPFLGLFILYAVAIFVIFWICRTLMLRMIARPSILLSNPEAAFRYKPGYLELAYLRGGTDAMFEAAVCGLYQRGLIDRYLKPATDLHIIEHAKRLTGLERIIWNKAEDLAKGIEIRNSPSIRKEIELAKGRCREKLIELGLIPPDESWVVVIASVVAALIFVDGLGIIRLIRSNLRGYHNVGILVFMMVMLSLGIVVGLCYMRRTHSGHIYLKQLQNEGRDVRRRMEARTARYSDPDVLYTVAALGTTAMAGSGYEDIHSCLEAILQRSRAASGRSSSNSGSCSSCGGGGCGGGGCGGGGCGGGGCGGG